MSLYDEELNAKAREQMSADGLAVCGQCERWRRLDSERLCFACAEQKQINKDRDKERARKAAGGK